MATIIIVEVYETFRDAGVPEDKAKAAAKALADEEGRFGKMKADLLVLRLMVGAVLAGVVSIAVKSSIA